MEFEPDLTNLLIQMKINSIIRSTNKEEGITGAPKKIITETTQEMIDDYLNEQINQQGISKFVQPTVSPILVNPTLIKIKPDKDLNDELKLLINALSREEKEQDGKLEDIKKLQEKSALTISVIESKIEKDEKEKIDKEKQLTDEKAKTPPDSTVEAQLEKDILDLNRKIAQYQIDKINDEKTTKGQISSINTDVSIIQGKIKKISDDIDDKEKEIVTNRENYEENIKETNIAQTENDRKINEYKENVRYLSNKPLQTQRLVGESQEDYYTRLQKEITDDQARNTAADVLFQATTLTRKQLQSNLMEIIPTDINKRENIIRLFNENFDKMKEANKFWDPIKKKIKSTFGKDSPKTKAEEYFEIINLYLGKTAQQIAEVDKPTVNITPSKVEEEDPVDIEADFKDNVISGNPNYSYTDKSVNLKRSHHSLKLEYSGDEYSIRMSAEIKTVQPSQGQAQKQAAVEVQTREIFLKAIVKPTISNKYVLMWSADGKRTTFRVIKTAIDLTNALAQQRFDKKDMNLQLFGSDFIVNKSPNVIAKLANVLAISFHKQASMDGIIKTGNSIIGAGINTQIEQSDYIKFGDVLINIKKLDKNILVIKDKNKASIKAYPNTRITDQLHDIILDIINKIPANEKDIKRLDESDLHVYNSLINISGKNRQTYNTMNQTIKYYKNRFNVLSGEIEAGNDNTKLLKEAYLILNHLYKMGEIKQNQVQKIYNDLVETHNKQ